MRLAGVEFNHLSQPHDVLFSAKNWRYIITSHIKYRPDIDGLRAVAILPVVIFHAFPQYVSGGFVGVDIFFVISGFLISSIILKEINEGKFTFHQFYARRIKRIFPALILVLTACLAAGWIALMPNEFDSLGKHVLSGAGFVSNFVLLSELGYFDSAAEFKPLLHLWSLAIEEQFYLVWPLVIWLAYKRKLNLFTTISILLTASFMLGIVTIKSYPSASFFLPVTRLWELLAGAALAYLAVQGRQIKGEGYQNFVSLVGLFLLSYGIFRLSASGFPGFKGLVPVLGALCLIAAGPNAWVNRHILGSRLFVGIGLISYPLYLWHWPLLSFARILEAGTPSPAIRVASVGISFVLAILTFLLLERPLKRIAAARLMPILLVLLVLVGATGGLIHGKEGVASRFADDENALFVRGDYFGGLDVRDCGKEFSKVASTHCRTTDSPTVAIFGDSHTAHLFHGMAIQSHDNAVMMLLAGACPPAKGVEVRPGCTQQYEDAIRIITSTPTIQTVILVAYYAYSDDEAMRSKMLVGYRQTIADLKGKQVVFLADTPTLKVSAETCFTRPVRLSSHAFEKCDLPRSAFDSSRVIYNDFVKSISKENQSIRVFDPTSLFCNTEVCEAFHDGKLQYTDNNHLSRDGGRRLAEWLDAERSKQRR